MKNIKFVFVLLLSFSTQVFADSPYYGKKLACEYSYGGIRKAVVALDKELSKAEYANKKISAPSVGAVRESNLVPTFSWACVSLSDW